MKEGTQIKLQLTKRRVLLGNIDLSYSIHGRNIILSLKEKKKPKTKQSEMLSTFNLRFYFISVRCRIPCFFYIIKFHWKRYLERINPAIPLWYPFKIRYLASAAKQKSLNGSYQLNLIFLENHRLPRVGRDPQRSFPTYQACAGKKKKFKTFHSTLSWLSCTS